jgi:hypothetical protein
MQCFGKWICFRLQMKGGKYLDLLRLLERTNLNLLISLPLPEEGSRSSFRNFSLVLILVWCILLRLCLTPEDGCIAETCSVVMCTVNTR